MNIDLLFTENGEAGLISSENLIKKAAGLVLDIQTGLLTLEYVDSDYTELNIPVDPDFFELMDAAAQIHVGAVKNGNIAQAYQIPLMFLDDPYRGQRQTTPMASNPLHAFNLFIKRCNAGQPVHRDDLGDEDSMGCVLGDASPAALQFAPHLAQRHALEAAPRAPGIQHAPRMGGPGMGSSSGGGAVYRKPPQNTEE